jgi:nitrous oxidase accessory protein
MITSNKKQIIVLGFSLLLTFVISPLFGRTVYVGQSHAIKTIKDGIQSAGIGDTVLVDGGIYREGNIVLTKAISLFGKNTPVLDGENKFELITLSGKNITISGFKFLNSGASAMNDFASIKCIDASEISISNNIIVNAYFAIHVSNTTLIHIKSNRIEGYSKNEQNTGNGIHLWKCNHAVIEDNYVSGHRDGIYFEFVTESRILNNYSTKNIRYGLHFMFSHNDEYDHNTFIENGAGVAVMYSHDVHMENNTFENNWGASAYGILLKDISDSRVHNNFFVKNTVGIHMEGSSRMIIEKNAFRDNGWGLKVQASCNDNIFQFNNFMGNSFDVATNGTMMLNKFTCNYWDKFEGYDLNKDSFGDVPYHPVSMYAMIVEENPVCLILLRSILISILDKAEKAIPSITPVDLVDDKPKMNPNTL